VAASMIVGMSSPYGPNCSIDAALPLPTRHEFSMYCETGGARIFVGWLIEFLKLSREELLSEEAPTQVERPEVRVPAEVSRRQAIRYV